MATRPAYNKSQPMTRPALNKNAKGPALNKANTPAQNDHGASYNKPAPQAGQNAQAGQLLTALQQAEAAFNGSKPGKDREAAQAALVAAQQAVAAAGIDPKNPPPGSMDATNIQNLVGPGAEGATALANQLYAPGGLGRVTTGFDAQGNRIDENQQILNRYDAMAQQYFGPAPGRAGETSAYLTQLQKNIQHTPETERYLAGMNAAQGRTGEDADVIRRMQAGLEGYTGAENQGYMESARQGIDQQYRTQLRDINKLRGKGGVTGGLERELGRDTIRANQDLQRDIFVRNADERQNRLHGYGSYLGGVQGAEAQRRGQYGSALGAAEGARAGRMDAYGSYMQGAQRDDDARKQAHFGRQMDTQGAYADRLQAMRDDELGRQQYNLEQGEKETAGRYGAYFGGLQLNLANREFDEAGRVNDALYDLNKDSKRPPRPGAATPTYRGGSSPYARYLGGVR